jgi:hypothetical protein
MQKMVMKSKEHKNPPHSVPSTIHREVDCEVVDGENNFSDSQQNIMFREIECQLKNVRTIATLDHDPWEGLGVDLELSACNIPRTTNQKK